MMHKPNGSDSEKLRTVVMVDDDAADLLLAERAILAAFPLFQVVPLNSGTQLLDYLEAREPFVDRGKFPYPSFVLLDLTMRGMTGLDVLRWLSGNPPHNQLPVHVLSGTDSPELAEITVLLGARSFITKPLTVAEFRNVVAVSEINSGGKPERS